MNSTTPFSVNQHKFIYTLRTVKTKYTFSYEDIEASIFFFISKYCGGKRTKNSHYKTTS